MTDLLWHFRSCVGHATSSGRLVRESVNQPCSGPSSLSRFSRQVHTDTRMHSRPQGKQAGCASRHRKSPDLHALWGTTHNNADFPDTHSRPSRREIGTPASRTRRATPARCCREQVPREGSEPELQHSSPLLYGVGDLPADRGSAETVHRPDRVQSRDIVKHLPFRVLAADGFAGRCSDC